MYIIYLLCIISLFLNHLFLRKTAIYFFLLLNVFLVKTNDAQVSAPSLKCASVNNLGNITLNWVIPSDPLGLFTSYQIYTSPISTGPFTLVTTVNTYTQSTYLHATNAGTIQSQYYYIKTIYSVTSNSLPSDTLRSIFLNVVNPGGQAMLSWNATRTPLLSSAATTYTLERENPPMTWSTIFSGSTLSFNDDSISVCNIFYNYKITTSDSLGCNSQSNVNGDLFQDVTSPDIPLLDSVSVTILGQATLGWEPANAPDTKGYEVYQFTGVWTKIATVLGRFNNSYTNTASLANTVSEKYCILAFDSCGNLGLQGIVNNTDQNTLFLQTTYDLCSRTASLNWNAYTNMPNGLFQYDVYCSINGSIPSVIATVFGLTYSHSGLNPNDTYCYFIRARNSGNTITASSNIECEIARVPAGPSFVYIKSVSVNLNKQIDITYMIDNSRAYLGATIFKSSDGVNFSQIAYQAYTTTTLQVYTDNNVSTSSKMYYYKIQITDSCGNLGQISNISNSILLNVSNDNSNVFYNVLNWEHYATWSGSVSSYNVYRAINGVFNPTPIINLPFPRKTYTDDVQSFSSDQGKFSYYVEAVEGSGNIYGFVDIANSNIADAYVESEIFVPNAFAPRGKNYLWLPAAQFVEKTDYKVTVFDRWGTKVFETTSDTQAWDGKGTTDDMFIYFIEYKNARGEFKQLKGHLFLIR